MPSLVIVVVIPEIFSLLVKIEEAVRLGMKNIVVPKLEDDLNDNFQNLINIKEISNIKEAVDYSLSK